MNNGLFVCRPMLDTYLKELGAMFLSKLLRGKITGIQQSSKLLIPWQVMVNLILLAKSYGAVVVGETKKNSKEKKIMRTVLTDSCISKIWHTVKCLRNCMSRRRYVKSAEDPKKYIYNGCSKVVVTPNTPLLLSYEPKSQKVVMTFYVQRYDKGNVATNAALQAKINAE